MNAKAILRATLGLALSIVFVVLIVRTIPLAQLPALLPHLQPLWLALAVGVFVADYALRITRWHLMLKPLNPTLGWARCATPFMVSIAANNVLPFRAGDVLRATAFSSWLNVPTTPLVGTLVVERLMDLLALFTALGLALAFLSIPTTSTLIGSSGPLLILLAMAILAVLVFPALLHRPITMALSILHHISPSLARKAKPEATRLTALLTTLSQGRLLVPLLATSAVLWMLEATTFYAVARSLPPLTNPMAAWLAMPVGTLSTLLPSSPGYVGTFHYFVIQALQTMGNPPAAAALFAILVHLVLWLCTTVTGGICALYWVWSRTPSNRQGHRS
ncbi:MAG: lysylphosphatidylglycerol synthase transmembrane domain-containing protein [Alphaproteobacteria bacterium]